MMLRVLHVKSWLILTTSNNLCEYDFIKVMEFIVFVLSFLRHPVEVSKRVNHTSCVKGALMY